MAATTVTNNAPTPGSITWTAFSIAYAGASYPVPAGNSAAKYVWWKYNKGAPQVLGQDTFPSMSTDDTILFLNKNGVGLFLPNTTILDGSLIVPESIFAPAIASDQITTKHLAVGSVEAENINSGAVTTRSLSVGSVSDNLIANGSFEDFINGDLEGWTLVEQAGGTVLPVTGVASSGQVSIQYEATSTSASLKLRQVPGKYIPISASSARRWYFSMRAGASVPTTNGATLRVHWFDASRIPLKTVPFTDVVANRALTTAFQVMEGQALPPVDAQWAGVEVILANPSIPTKMYVDEVTAYQVIISARIGDGEITAAKVNTEEFFADRAVIDSLVGRMATYLTNTDGSGYTNKISGEGLRVTFTGPDGSIQDVIKLGTFGDDRFSLYKDGKPTVYISPEGGSFKTLEAAESIKYRGRELDDLMSPMGSGVYNWGELNFGPFNGPDELKIGSSVFMGVASVDYITPGNRMSRITFRTPTLAFVGSGAGEAVWAIKFRTTSANDTTPITEANSSTFDNYYMKNPGENVWHQHTLTIHRPIPASEAGTKFQILFMAIVKGGPTYMRIFQPGSIVVDDAGELPANPSVVRNSGGGKPYNTNIAIPATRSGTTRVMEWESIGVRSYKGDGSWSPPTSDYESKVGAQGPAPVVRGFPDLGNQKSLFLFPDFAPWIWGSTIDKIEVLMRFDSWYYRDGGVAKIHLHGNLDRLPDGFNGAFSHDETGWGSNSERWFRIGPQHFAGFLSGAYRGIGLGGDNTLRTRGIASRCRIKITYTK